MGSASGQRRELGGEAATEEGRAVAWRVVNTQGEDRLSDRVSSVPVTSL